MAAAALAAVALALLSRQSSEPRSLLQVVTLDELADRRYVRCTATDCDAMPAVDADDPSTIVIFTSRLFGNNNSAAFLQRSTVPFSFAAAFNDDGDGSRDLIIDSQSSGDTQGLLGFGGAFTDAAADALASVSRPLQAQLLRQYFGPDGLGYRLGRVPIGHKLMAGAEFATNSTRMEARLGGGGRGLARESVSVSLFFFDNLMVVTLMMDHSVG